MVQQMNLISVRIYLFGNPANMRHVLFLGSQFRVLLSQRIGMKFCKGTKGKCISYFNTGTTSVLIPSATAPVKFKDI